MVAWGALLFLTALVMVRGDGEPTQLTDETLDHFVQEYDVVMVNFYADWCRFCQQLRPIYEQAAMLLGDSVNARLARVDCEAADTVRLRERFHINKYPTLKIFRKGTVLKNEYRGQRSATAIESYIRELVRDPLHVVESEQDLLDTVHHQRAHEAITGRFSSASAAALPVFRAVAEALRDECLFVAHTTSTAAGASGSKISFQSRLDIVDYSGAVEFDALLTWARDLCNPLVREITFENGEQLTEEGLPFLILFYDPNNLTPVREFTDAVKARLQKERGQINFITADGTRFTHPIHHLGKTRADLPVLAFDTFKHMFLFKKFANIHKPGVLEQFVADLHSGKLHHDFHNPPPEVPEIEEAASTPAPGPKSLPADAPSANANAPANANAGQPAAAAAALGAPGPAGAPGPVGGAAEATPAATLPVNTDKAELLEARVQRAKEEKKTATEIAKEIRQKEKAAATTEDPEDDPSKPIAIRSVLQKLKPSENRYSILRNKDEL